LNFAHFLFRWASNVVAISLTAWLLPGIWITDWPSGILGALALGLLNAFVRPVLLFLTLPFNVVTLGLFTVALNGALLFTVGYIVPGVMIEGYGWAVLGSLLVSFFSTLLSWLFHEKPTIQGSVRIWRW